MNEQVFIVGGKRTPIGGLQGNLADITAVELGATAIKAIINQTDINPANIDEVFMGCVLSAGLKQCPARQAMLSAGIPNSAGAVTINKACGSGMQATIYSVDSIIAGTNHIVIAGGLESMSNAPHILPSSRKGLRLGHGKIYDHMFLDGLEDAYTGAAMGDFAQKTADEYNLDREEMDAFAITSLTRAKTAIEKNLIAKEVTPVTITTHRGKHVVTHDEQPLKGNPDKIPSLRPVFSKNGSITAANSSSISDGASALLLASESAIIAHHLKPMARVVAHTRFSCAPQDFTLAPAGAIECLLKKVNWTVNDIDLWEINEAFAMVTMLSMRTFDLDHEKVNVHGGACAQGHPIGSTGSRIIVTLTHALKYYGKKRGIACLCIGGGEATAIAIEMVD